MLISARRRRFFFQTTSYCEDFLMKIAFRIPSNITVYNHQKTAYNPQKTAYNPPDFLLKPHISQTAYKPKILLKPHIRQPVLYAYIVVKSMVTPKMCKKVKNNYSSRGIH